MRVDFVGGSRDAVLRARLTEFAYHQVFATMTVPTHSFALKRLHRSETTVSSPWPTFVSYVDGAPAGHAYQPNPSGATGSRGSRAYMHVIRLITVTLTALRDDPLRAG
jgi:hypothetical protein